MKATKENIEGLLQLGFKEVNKKKYIYEDLVAYIPLQGEYLSFKYGKEKLPIINTIASIKKLIEGIYEYKF